MNEVAAMSNLIVDRKTVRKIPPKTCVNNFKKEWFDNDCKVARSNYIKRKSRYRFLQTTDTHNALIQNLLLARSLLIKTMNDFKNKVNKKLNSVGTNSKQEVFYEHYCQTQTMKQVPTYTFILYLVTMLKLINR